MGITYSESSEILHGFSQQIQISVYAWLQMTKKRVLLNISICNMQTQRYKKEKKKICIWRKRQLIFTLCFFKLLGLLLLINVFLFSNTVPKIKMNNMCNFLSVYIPCLHGRNLKLLNRTDQNTQKVKKNVFNGTVQNNLHIYETNPFDFGNSFGTMTIAKQKWKSLGQFCMKVAPAWQ